MVLTDSDVHLEVESEPPRRTSAIVISGTSGVGKGYMIEQFLCQLGNRVGLCVNHTSCEPRNGEREGLHYYFRSWKEMETEIAGGDFLGYAEVNDNSSSPLCDRSAGGCSYWGTPGETTAHST